MQYNNRYKCHQRVQKRVVFDLPISRGKRHFWGQPHKNYGFYTSEEQESLAKYGQRLKQCQDETLQKDVKCFNVDRKRQCMTEEDQKQSKSTDKIGKNSSQRQVRSISTNKFFHHCKPSQHNKQYQQFDNNQNHEQNPEQPRFPNSYQIIKGKNPFKIYHNFNIALPSVRKLRPMSKMKYTPMSNIEMNPSLAKRTNENGLLPNLRKYYGEKMCSPTYLSSLSNPLLTIVGVDGEE